MKFRMGFVSNSSTSSFYIYGWTEEVISKAIGELMPIFKDVKMFIDADDFVESLSKAYNGKDYDLLSFTDQSGQLVFGVGWGDTEIHYEIEDPPISWITQDQKDQMNEIAKRMHLPIPQEYKDTFFEG